MKKILIILSVFAIVLTGCVKDPDPVSTVVTVTHPGITLNGPAFIHLPVGGSYTEQGAILTDDLSGAQSPIDANSNDLNTSAMGMYKVLYLARNSNGFKTEAIRTILVMDYTPPPTLDPNWDISGTYKRSGNTVTIAKVNNGLYIIDKVGGSSNVPAYILTPDTLSIDIPAQESWDGFPLDCINETFIPGPPIKLTWNVDAENFGTQNRTFIKQ